MSAQHGPAVSLRARLNGFWLMPFLQSSKEVTVQAWTLAQPNASPCVSVKSSIHLQPLIQAGEAEREEKRPGKRTDASWSAFSICTHAQSKISWKYWCYCHVHHPTGCAGGLLRQSWCPDLARLGNSCLKYEATSSLKKKEKKNKLAFWLELLAVTLIKKITVPFVLRMKSRKSFNICKVWKSFTSIMWNPSK